MATPNFKEMFWDHRGLLSDSWEHYIWIYDAELRRFFEQGTPVSLLEIGVQNGGSLELWHKLLPPGSRIVGMDINESCGGLERVEGIEVHIGDATRRAFVDGALGDTQFDVIIDDGSHRSNDVIASFDILFERLRPGGLYIVEDMHASYWPKWGGGFRREGAAIEWAKDLVDALNTDHFEPNLQISRDELARLKALNKQVARIAFYDSVLVFQKYATTKDRPFSRLMTGAKAPVWNPIPWICNLSVDQSNELILGASLARDLVSEQNRRLADKEQKIGSQERELERLEQALQHQQQTNKSQAQRLKDLERRLGNLRRSISWRITAPLRYAGRTLKSVFGGRSKADQRRD